MCPRNPRPFRAVSIQLSAISFQRSAFSDQLSVGGMRVGGDSRASHRRLTRTTVNGRDRMAGKPPAEPVLKHGPQPPAAEMPVNGHADVTGGIVTVERGSAGRRRGVPPLHSEPMGLYAALLQRATRRRSYGVVIAHFCTSANERFELSRRRSGASRVICRLPTWVGRNSRTVLAPTVCFAAFRGCNAECGAEGSPSHQDDRKRP
jgi:hypothetical protein